MRKHPRRVRGYFGSLEKLARRVGYSDEYIVDFLKDSSIAFNNRSISDSMDGKKYLSLNLHISSENLYLAKEILEKILVESPRRKPFIFGYYGPIKELPKRIENMTYDQGAIFLNGLSKTLKQRSKIYSLKGEVKKAERFKLASKAVKNSGKGAKNAWDICKAYMIEK